jgi:hypothetical protein
MKLLSFLLLVVTQAFPPMLSPLIPDNTATITGLIRTADTSRAIPEAQVAVMKKDETPESAMTHAVLTDANGRFTIKRIPGGDYRVIVQAEGYIKPADDTPSSPWAGINISLSEGQNLGGIILELIAGGTVSGRVKRADGETVASASVEALRADYVNGRAVFTEVKRTLTDDLGDYRLYWLPPDDYYVRARYRPSSDNRSERYEALLFPGLADADVASLISVKATVETSAIDFRVETKPIGGVTISGRATTVDAALKDKPVSTVYVVPSGRTVTLTTDSSDAFKNEAADVADGQFLIRGVPAGLYDVIPVVKDEDGNLRSVRVPVEVADKDIENLAAPLSITAVLKGRVTVDGRVPDAIWANEVVLTSLDGLPAVLLNPPGPAASTGEVQAVVKFDKDTGEFVFPRVAPGQYALRLASPFDVPAAYLADVRQDDKSVFDRGFLVSEDEPKPLEIAIRSQGGTVLGTVLDSASVKTFARATVVLVPDAPRRGNPLLYRTAVSQEDGTFIMTGVAPGNYKLFAWQSVSRGAWGNTSFISKYESRGTPVSVDEGLGRTVRLQVISR